MNFIIIIIIITIGNIPIIYYLFLLIIHKGTQSNQNTVEGFDLNILKSTVRKKCFPFPDTFEGLTL